MIAGIGVDIIEVQRIKGAIERHGDRFLNRIYCDLEIEYCRGGAQPYQSFAARFAAKEAVLKSLGVGWQDGTRFTDIAVVMDAMGAPRISLSGKSLQISKRLGIRNIHISLSHTADYAVAQAVAERGVDCASPQ